MKTLIKIAVITLILLTSTGCSSQGFVKFLDIQPRDKFFVANAFPYRPIDCDGPLRQMYYKSPVCVQERMEKRMERMINRAIRKATPTFQGTILDPNYRARFR